MFRRRRKGQTSVEFVAIFIVVISALIVMSTYFKRGLQGRWRDVSDDIGDQYDPRIANSSIVTTLVGDTTTLIWITNVTDGTWTNRIDTSTTQERKVTHMEVPSYN